MTRWVPLAAIGPLLLLSGCVGHFVDLPNDRPPAVPVQLAAGPLRCPAVTVGYGDEEPQSGAGAVPDGFEARTVLRCQLDYVTMRTVNGVDRFTVQQWRAPSTPELRAALALPDRERQPARACAAATASLTAVYLVDAGRRSVRVHLPYDDPCHEVRKDVVALLPANAPPAEVTFRAVRKAR